MVSTAFWAPRKAASATAFLSPMNVITARLWFASISTSRSFVPVTDAIALAIESTTSFRRPSLKFGTHSMISRAIPILDSGTWERRVRNFHRWERLDGFAETHK